MPQALLNTHSYDPWVERLQGCGFGLFDSNNGVVRQLDAGSDASPPASKDDLCALAFCFGEGIGLSGELQIVERNIERVSRVTSASSIGHG